jgi:hypothetical protein
MTLSPKKKRAVVTTALLVVAVVGCPLVMMVKPGAPPDFSDSRSVYRWHGGRWTSVPPLPGGTEGLDVSSGGVVWATSPRHNGVSRWDGTRWVKYKGSDFGTVRDALPGGFALQGEEVWAAAREGVAYFDGQRWRLYPEAVKTRRAVATAAGPSGVWVIDSSANLSHYDGEAWSIESLKDTPAGADWANRIDEDLPELRETVDGAVWLLLHGLWRKDDAGWREIRRDDIDWYGATMIGQDGDRVWLRDDSRIIELKADGGTGRVFDRRDLPIMQGAAIYRLAVGGGKVWLATTKDLLAFDGKQWQRCGIPPGTTLVREVAMGADGSAWVIAEKRSLWRIARWVAPPLAAAALGLLVIGGLLVMWAKGLADQRLVADQAVVQAAGAMPGMDMAARQAEVKKQSRALWWKLPLFLIGFPYLVFAVRAGQRYLRGAWPGAPQWVTWAAVLAPVVVSGAFLLWRWFRKRSKSGRLFGSELRILLFACVFIFVLNRLPVPQSPLVRIVSLFGSIFLFTVLLQSRNILAVYFTRKLVLSGEYDRALRRLRWPIFRGPTPQILVVEGFIHAGAGHSVEAEQCYRRALGEARNAPSAFRAQTLCLLGFALSNLGRYEEAERCQESVIAMGDKMGSARVGIAESLLLQGKDPERALALLEEAMKIKKSRQAQPERMATKAWALALMGRQREMQEAMTTALGEIDPSLKAVVASVNWRIGKALVAVQRAAEAMEHFRTACQEDPQGDNGAIARLELERYGALGD